MKKEASPASAEADSSQNLRAAFANLSKDELIALLIGHLKDNKSEALPTQTGVMLPSAIFANDALSALETIVKYLKENKQMSFHEIAKLLNRDDRSIWTTYHNARKKMGAALASAPSTFYIPAEIFAARKLSVLETIAMYCKDTLNMSLHDIAKALRRDDRTIWTVCNRAQKKGGAA